MSTFDYSSSRRILGAGYFVSNDARRTGLNNFDVLLGQPGAGKTGGYVIPNLQILDHSLIVSDTKGNLCRKFRDDLISRGFKVSVLDIVRPEQSCPYNPLMYIKRYPKGRYREQDVISIANTLVPIMDKHEPFWEMAARSYLAFLIGYTLETEPRERQNLYTVIKKHQQFCDPSKRLEFDVHTTRKPELFSSRKYKQLRGSMSAEKMWSSILEFASQSLNIYDTESMLNIIGRTDSFDIASLGREKQVLFLNVSDTDRTYDNLVNSFYTQALQTLCAEADGRPDNRLDIPVRMILDDFATNTRIEDFDKILSVIRSREIYVSIILQCMSQLESLYGSSVSKTILNNCDHIIYLGGHDYDTAYYVATHAFTSPEAVLTMRRDKEYVLETGKRGIMFDKIVPYSTIDTVPAEVQLQPSDDAELQ